MVYYDTLTMLIFFLLATRFLERNAREKSIEAAENLLRLVPAIVIGGEPYWREIFYKQTVGRAVGAWVADILLRADVASNLLDPELEPLDLKLCCGVFEVPARSRVVAVVEKVVNRIDVDANVDGMRLQALGLG